MIRNYGRTPSFEDTCQTKEPTDRSVQRPTSSSRPAATMLRAIWNALRDGLAVQRQYEHLRSRGASHDRALREALGIRISASEVRVAAQYQSCPLTDTTRIGETLCGRRVSACANLDPPLPASARVGNLAYVK